MSDEPLTNAVTKYYTVVMTGTITNSDWMPTYLADVPALVARHGGRYLAKTDDIDRLQGEGDMPSAVALLEWPSKEAAEAFFTDSDYRPYLEARLAGASGFNYLFPAADEA